MSDKEQLESLSEKIIRLEDEIEVHYLAYENGLKQIDKLLKEYEAIKREIINSEVRE